MTQGRVRLWVDRRFTIRGAGTVVTGTLGEGTIATGDELLVGAVVRVRGVQSLERPRDAVPAVARVAVNLRGVSVEGVRRGDALLTPGAWRVTSSVDVRLRGCRASDLPRHVMLHVGTTAAEVTVRPLTDETARLTLATPLPLRAGDHAILRDPGLQHMAGGVIVVDADPPPLTRRGAAARRGEQLSATGRPDLAGEVARRGAMRRTDAAALGLLADDLSPGTPGTIRAVGAWLVDEDCWRGWESKSWRAALVARAAADPLDPALTLEAARAAADLPDRALVGPVAATAGLDLGEGRVSLPGVGATLDLRPRAVCAPSRSACASSPSPPPSGAT